MIVRHESDGSLVMIAQNDHAKVSGLCASHWGNERFARAHPYEACVRAAFLHDLAWLREETSPRFDPATGTTINYLDVANESQLDEYPWSTHWLEKLDAYTALLVSKHRTGIWKSRYGLMTKPNYPVRRLGPQIEALVDKLHAEQKAAMTAFDEHEVTTNYVLLQIWDLLSLYICSTETLKETSWEPVPTSYARRPGESIQLVPVEPNRISISPYPFDCPSLDVSVVHRRLPTSHFADVQSFHAAYFNTTPRVATFTFFDPEAN